ncbi:pyruvate dehydrogenase [Nigerium massiliense]|uniref:pyruvate dehydrogenase n=1 Tax=Nigerium massiliense TaxID=1522317 RepID=UPI00058D6633|nr:pyruvate dehydrogenase [Nigerium massiliense]
MELAEQIVSQLQAAGVRRIYGIVGDSLNPIVDAVRRTGGPSKPDGIQWVHVRHEEAAAFMASADAQLTGELAVCAGSCGPGNLHLINGLYDANRSGAPVLAIASHIPSPQIGTGYFQETHPDRLFTECSVFSEMITSADQSPRIVDSAMHHAIAKQGVAVITLPGDVAQNEVTKDAPAWRDVVEPTLVPDAGAVAELVSMIDAADKVAIFAGLGARGSREKIVALADKLGAPVGHSLRGKDFVQDENPFDVGMTGLLGYGAAAAGMNDADLLLLLGTDFPYDQFLPGTKTVQIDRDAAVIGRRTPVDLGIAADLAPTLDLVLKAVKPKKSRKFLRDTLKKHDRLMGGTNAYTKNVKKMKPIHPEYVAAVLDELAAPDAIFTADTGMCNVWTARYLHTNDNRRLIGSFKHGSMANALPQALGAQFAYPDRQVISVSGDGGLSMLLGELVTAAMYQLPVTILAFNNSTLGMVRLEMLVDGLPDFGTDVPDVSYAKVAEALGFHAERVTEAKDVYKALNDALNHKGPSLVEVMTDPDALSLPPAVTGEQLIGFATAMSKIVLGGGAGEVISMAKSNLRNIPREWKL